MVSFFKLEKRYENSDFYFYTSIVMKMKHFLVLMVLCGGIIAIIAYHVGASNNYLSTTQTTFSDLSSSNHANQLKVTMRDAMINKLSHWAQNHETRLQVHAQSTTHPNLTNDQLSFSSFLSSKNNNMLTAQMRDGLVGRFTTVLTNHEMRLRCIQDGSCLKTGATVTPPVKEVYHCVGDYRTRQRNRCQPHPDREMITACLRRDVVESLGSPSPEFYGGSDIRGY